MVYQKICEGGEVMNEFMQYVAEFSYPTAIVASYVVITLVQQYTKLQPKYYLLIAVVTGVLVVVLEEILSNPITVQKVIAGALSGVIAAMSYEAIHKVIANKNKN